MTYKQVVSGFLRRDSQNWVEKLLDNSGIKYKFAEAAEPELEKHDDPKYFGFYYTVPVKIYTNWYIFETVLVGGTVSDSGIYHSVVWNEMKEILWMSVESTRKDLGIEEFKLS